MTVPVPDLGTAVTAPQRPFCASQGISLSLLTALLKDGEVDSVIVGGRFRYVLLASWSAYIRRKQLGLERDPVEREAAAARYRNSVSPAATLAAKRALAAKPKPGRPLGSGTRHRTGDGRPGRPPDSASKSAGSPGRVSPPPTETAPKTNPTSRRGTRKETTAHT
jgi:hypothetical protein